MNGGPRAARYVTPERLGIPLLYMTRLQDEGTIGTELLARIRYTDVYLATLDAANHMAFSSWSLRMAPDAAFTGGTRAQAAQAYGAMAQTVERFLDARLKGDAAARRQLDEALAAPRPPAGFLSFAVRRAQARRRRSTPSSTSWASRASSTSARSTTACTRKTPTSSSTRCRRTTGA